MLALKSSLGYHPAMERTITVRSFRIDKEEAELKAFGKLKEAELKDAAWSVASLSSEQADAEKLVKMAAAGL